MLLTIVLSQDLCLLSIAELVCRILAVVSQLLRIMDCCFLCLVDRVCIGVLFSWSDSRSSVSSVLVRLSFCLMSLCWGSSK